jgi:hypothetical protein
MALEEHPVLYDESADGGFLAVDSGQWDCPFCGEEMVYTHDPDGFLGECEYFDGVCPTCGRFSALAFDYRATLIDWPELAHYRMEQLTRRLCAEEMA